VKANFVDRASVGVLDAADHVATLARLAESAVGGGRTYDALIAASARKAKAHALLTLNPKHFDSSEGFEIVCP
jgi:predicted nucleic acid-binding protein